MFDHHSRTFCNEQIENSLNLAGRTVTVHVRLADMRAVTSSLTLDVPISATSMAAEELVRAALADHPRERVITLLAVSIPEPVRPAY